MSAAPPKVLTIAGSDSGGGAGIQADLKTFAALGVYGASVITALTAQNSLGVSAIHTPPGEFVYQQFEAVMSDIGADAGKTGMLANAEVIDAVARGLDRWPIEKLVVDPVMVSTSGDGLLEADAVQVYRQRIIPKAFLVTPNLAEARVLTERAIDSEDSEKNRKEIEAAAKDLIRMGAKAVLIKGGHFAASEFSNDLFHDGERSVLIEAARVQNNNTHGSGCTLAAAIAALLAQGESLDVAIRRAKELISRAIETAYAVGSGPGPLNHFSIRQ